MTTTAGHSDQACGDCGGGGAFTCGHCGDGYVPAQESEHGRFSARVLPAWERARIEVNDGLGSDLTVEVSELRDADTGQMFWTVSVRPYGEREVRVYTGESLEASLTWEKGEWE